METGETAECENCGRTVPVEELGEWTAPEGWTVKCCGECAANLEMEL